MSGLRLTEMMSRLSGLQLHHQAQSMIVAMAEIDGFLLVCTECHGSYFLDRDGNRVALPLVTGPERLE